LTGPISRQTGDGEAWHQCKDRGKSLLIMPVRRGRQRHRDFAEDRKQSHSQKSQPNGPPRRRIAIYLRKDVTEDIGDGEEQLGSTEFEWANLAHFGAKQIRNDEHNDEDDRKRVKIA